MVTAERLRAMVGALPETEEVETWGHPTFRVRGKMFAGMAEDGSTVIVKAAKQEQAALVAGDPETFAVAPYVGRHGWVQVQLQRVDPAQLEELLVEGWRATAPKRVVASHDAAS